MEKEKQKQALEALLFANGKPVSIHLLSNILEIEEEEVELCLKELKEELEKESRGIQLIQIDDTYQFVTKEEFYPYLCKMMDRRPKPSLSQAALEALAIIAYNPGITRAEMERIRGVSSDSAMNKLMEYNLIEEAGRMEAPGRPVMYRTTDEFLRLFGYISLKDLPELPKLVEEEMNQVSIEEIPKD